MRRRKSSGSSRSALMCRMLLLINVASFACGLSDAPIPPSAKNDGRVLMSSDDPVELKISNGNKKVEMTILAQSIDKLSFTAIYPSGTTFDHKMKLSATLTYGNCNIDLKWSADEYGKHFSLISENGKNIEVTGGSSSVRVILKEGKLICLDKKERVLDKSCHLDFSRASDGEGYVMKVSLEAKGDIDGEIKLKFDSEYKRYEPPPAEVPVAEREAPSKEWAWHIYALIGVGVIILGFSLLAGIIVASYYCCCKKKGYNWDGTKTTIVYQTATPGTKKRTGTTQPTPTPIIAKKTSKISKDKKTKKPSQPDISPKELEANDKTQNQKCIVERKRYQPRPPKNYWKLIPGDEKDTFEWTGGPDDPEMTSRNFYDMKEILGWPTGLTTRTDATQSDDVPCPKKNIAPGPKKNIAPSQKKKDIAPSQKNKKQKAAVLPVQKTQESERQQKRVQMLARTI